MIYKQITDFAAKLRGIDGIHLFKIFTKYTLAGFIDINQLFNYLAKKEKEDDLRKLEKLWDVFIKTGDITVEKLDYKKNSDEQDDDDDDDVG